MPYKQFDISKLKLSPLSERVNDLTLEDITWEEPTPFDHPDLDHICEAILTARQKGAAVIMMYGAHVIRRGCAGLMIRLMEKGLITHFATNGAGAIHDFELAMMGATCESVARYISEGLFGLWAETGRLNDAVAEGAREGLGFGEAVGRFVIDHCFPYISTSVIAAGYSCRTPVTVHVSLGSDIVHEHPNCDGAAIGKATMTDFLIYAKSVENLEGGVFLNVGSAVTGPEVYLKSLSMARNVAKQEGRKITDFTTAVFDILPLSDADYRKAPLQSNPQYYFRPWKTILARTVADGGRSFYVRGDHRETFGNLAVKLLNRLDGKKNGSSG